MGYKDIGQQLCPPAIWQALRLLKNLFRRDSHITYSHLSGPEGQDIEVYWSPEMAEVLETWGLGNVWDEIQYLMVNCEGKVLDIACGTGKTMALLSKFAELDVYGCDISDFLISKALERGLRPDRLVTGDATEMSFDENYFDYAYSIGSLEHFTEDGLLKVLSECHRVTSKKSFHQVPVSRKDEDEGWMKTHQSFFNNSVGWWLDKYTSVYDTVYVLDSRWEDSISVGKWFVCVK